MNALFNKKERPFYQPGWYRELTNEEYHGSFGTSSSTIKKLIEKTPAHLHYDMHHPKESTESMAMGTLVHTLVLEPEKFEQEYMVCPSDLKAPTARQLEAKNPSDKTLVQIAEWEAWQKQAEGKQIISQAQFDQANQMAQSVLSHPTASALLQDKIVESSIYWWYRPTDGDDDRKYKELLKVRPDVIDTTHGVIADLKTTTDASYDGFVKSIQKYYYHLSAAMYLDGVNQCKELLDATGFFAYTKFLFICVESVPPYLCAVYELSKDYVEVGQLLYRRSLIKLHESRADEEPRGFPRELRVIEPPSWAKRLYIV